MENIMQSGRDHIKKNWGNKNFRQLQPSYTSHTVKSFRYNLYNIKIFFIVSFMGITLPLIWIQYTLQLNRPRMIDNKILDRHKHVSLYNKHVRRSKNVKYILIWTRPFRTPAKYFATKINMFEKNNCSVKKCYVTRNRKFFNSNLRRFDAIGFIGQDFNASDIPDVRSSHQKYIYFNTESADNYPGCEPQLDGFFNWTSTYRLDSDIPYPYILIRDMKGNIVGPKQEMSWKKDMAPVDDAFADKIASKTKAAACFVSNCRSARSGRLQLVRELQLALKLHGLTMDVYGNCGTLKCPKEQMAECDQMLERDYYFYMSMENSFAEDYVTEKLLRALQHNVIPIVYGGADYSRFLPPGSYINARKRNVIELAAMMSYLINSPEKYLQYFRWKNYYTYHNPIEVENVCALCKALHNKKKLKETTVYYKFRRWWYPNFKRRCIRIMQRRYGNVTIPLDVTPAPTCC